MSNKTKKFTDSIRKTHKRVLRESMKDIEKTDCLYDASARVGDPVELYAVQAAGWKKGSYADRDFDAVNAEVRVEENGAVHLLLKKSFGGYNGDQKFHERVLDIKFDPISIERLQEFFNTAEGEII